MQRAVQKALSLVGQGYIYGAKGQTCSERFRQQQAQQYPEQAGMILGKGAKWDGMPVWDCAQLTRAAAAAAGVTLVSGATSQWKQTQWAQTGVIADLPADTPAFVFRGDGQTMQHTGLALGDGTCVHARGTAYGVVHEPLADDPWTHFAIPRVQPVCRAVVTALTGSTVNLRQSPAGRLIRRIPIGTQAEVLSSRDGWSHVTIDGEEGYMQSTFLRREDALEELMRKLEAIEARLERAGL